MPRQQATTAERGYGRAHVIERVKWTPIVERGDGWCAATTCIKRSRWIQPGTPWDLGHTEDRTTWTGPEHAACNRREGAIRGNKSRGRRRAAILTRRKWRL